MSGTKCLLPAIAALLAAMGCADDKTAARVVGQLASDRIEIAAEFAERLSERLVAEGQAVSAGELILRQDTTRIDARIAESQAALAEAEARQAELIRGPRREQILALQAKVRGAEKELEFRETELERAIRVFERNLSAPEVRDRALVARDAARANLQSLAAELEQLLTGTTSEELRQAEAAVARTAAAVAALQVERDRHSYAAPVAGVVDSLPFETGETPGKGQPIAVVLAGEQAHARVFVPESVRVHVQPGAPARVFVDGLDKPLAGRVRWVSSDTAFTPYFALTERDRGRLSYAAKIDILDADRRLPDGVPVEVEFTGVYDNE